jgi:hypothetical protein
LATPPDEPIASPASPRGGGPLADRDRQPDWTQRVTALVAVAALLVAFGGLVVARWQWDAMKDANRAMQDQLVFGQRAYVLPAKIVQEPFGSPEKGVIRLRVQWENSGNTPTRRMRSYVNFIPRRDPLPKGYNYPDFTVEEGKARVTDTPDAARGFIPPKGQVVSAASFDVATERTRDLGSRFRLYSWGWVEYRDIFVGTPPRITKFCYEITSITIEGKSARLTATQCDENNCTDEECNDLHSGKG